MKDCEADCDKPATTKWRGKWYCDEHADIAEDMDWNPEEDEQEETAPPPTK